jgi:hypothetical protein
LDTPLFRTHDTDNFRVPINVFQAKTRDLTAPQTILCQQQQDGPVAN